MDVLVYLPKLKRGLGPAFGKHLYLWTKFQFHTFFPCQDIKQNALLSSYFDN